MESMRSPRVTAVLGPTNTGKTYLAIERMLGHRSGVIGFPLRLLARENYDRAAGLRGRRQVALVTGEEKIVPRGARYFFCTVESMPVDRPFDFLAVDEVQLCGDAERGHVFTDRLLHARGESETMFLGADTIRPLLKRLAPEAEVISRPRFSTLSYLGPRKLTRLPPRSAVIAFSAAEVYALAELMRRQSGGTAVVLGALSPRTRNAQVALFEAGEVDYLVATDAIGMGLNLNLDHVAFTRLGKFDGRLPRRLTPAEVGQIAGRAGRHMSDGTFGASGQLTWSKRSNSTASTRWKRSIGAAAGSTSSRRSACSPASRPDRRRRSWCGRARAATTWRSRPWPKTRKSPGGPAAARRCASCGTSAGSRTSRRSCRISTPPC
jgi:ATP-dependent RNA helicase SUPV3L1/SUV3